MYALKYNFYAIFIIFKTRKSIMLSPNVLSPQPLTNAKQANNSVSARQIAFLAAFLLPASKLLEAPSILAKHAAGDLLFPAVLHFLVQALVLLGVLYTSSKSATPLIERLKSVLGKGVYPFYILYAAYFLLSATLPLLDAEKFVYATYFDTAPTLFSFGIFFLFSAFVCTKGITAIGRCADLCIFLFLVPFLALSFMAFSETDFSALLPFFSTKLNRSLTAFTRTSPHFSDTILLFPLIANLRYREKDGMKIVTGYAAGGAFTLLFLAIFYGLFSTIAPREHYAFTKIGQYFPALSVVVRIDLLFVYFLSVVLLFYTCLPLQYLTTALAYLFRTERKTYISALLNFALLIGILFFNQKYNRFYAVISGKLAPVFWIFADLFPLLCLLLPTQKIGGRYALNDKNPL